MQIPWEMRYSPVINLQAEILSGSKQRVDAELGIRKHLL